MSESSRTFTHVACLMLIVLAVGFLWWGAGNPESASPEPAADGRNTAQGKSSFPEVGDAGRPEAGGPRLGTKSNVRPGPDEMVEMRLKRKKQDLMNQLESLREDGYGNMHPQVRAKQAELDALAEEEAAGR